MFTFKSIVLYGLVAASSVLAVPTAEVQSMDAYIPPTGAEVAEADPAPVLAERKLPNKCEAWIHIDQSNGLCGNRCTTKYNINLLDKPGRPMGKTFDWSKVGTWSATNPNDNRIVIPTTLGPQLWIDGYIPRGIYIRNDKWRNSFTLHYGAQHWNSRDCPNHRYKSPRISNGHRHEFDLWCEFDC
ncbi:hypothetical protein BJ508DRAFT_324563 [Ascobolus immersus RN42]|uniref:Uncharacterized protein n=1 Tax=Ascobolus immersus RN42 TaxID=1160509 RepID=A0A3N4IDB4_ASCIM|nr:hypothetical protein BJ508DRAFT_324563 [Ascobolus immersus RN42]